MLFKNSRITDMINDTRTKPDNACENQLSLPAAAAPPPPPPTGGEQGEGGEEGEGGSEIFEIDNTNAVNNPTVVEAPLEIVPVAPANEQQANIEFGSDFPGLVEAPLLTEDPLLEDPVASGGDSSLYSSDNVDGGTPSPAEEEG